MRSARLEPGYIFPFFFLLENNMLVKLPVYHWQLLQLLQYLPLLMKQQFFPEVGDSTSLFLHFLLFGNYCTCQNEFHASLSNALFTILTPSTFRSSIQSNRRENLSNAKECKYAVSSLAQTRRRNKISKGLK